MNIRPIRSEADYEAALAEIDRLIDAPDESLEADYLDVLSTLVEAYEEQHYPIPLPDPIAYILYGKPGINWGRSSFRAHYASSK